MPQRFDACQIWAVPLRCSSALCHACARHLYAFAHPLFTLPTLCAALPLPRVARLGFSIAILRVGLPCPCAAILCHDMPLRCAGMPHNARAMRMITLPYLCISELHDAIALRSYAYAMPFPAKQHNAIAFPRLAMLCFAPAPRYVAFALLLSQCNAPQNCASAVLRDTDTLPVPWSAFPCPGHTVHCDAVA